MGNLKDSLQLNSTLESQVYDLLCKCCSKDESVKIDEVLELQENSKQIIDFYLPKGVNVLHYPENTYIEVKLRLTIQAIRMLMITSSISSINKFVVIYNERLISQDIINKCKNIEFLHISEFQDTVVKILSSQQKKSVCASSKESADVCLRKLEDAVINKRLSLFIGAGVSASAGVPTWQSLLEMLCVKVGVDKIDSDINELTKARFIINEKYKDKDGIKEAFYDDIKEILYTNNKSSSLMEAISHLVSKRNVESIITYNYDSLLESYINQKGKKCESVFDKTRTDLLPVYHVHGYVSEHGYHSDIVLGEVEYHSIYGEAFHWGNVEQLHALSRNTCLFIGLSMKDPNLRRLIDISISGSEVEPIHYVFLRKIEYNVVLMDNIMRSFGINCVWYENYSDLPELLKKLADI